MTHHFLNLCKDSRGVFYYSILQMKKLSKAERSCYMPESINGAQPQIHASSKALSIVLFTLPTYFKVYCQWTLPSHRTAQKHSRAPSHLWRKKWESFGLICKILYIWNQPTAWVLSHYSVSWTWHGKQTIFHYSSWKLSICQPLCACLNQTLCWECSWGCHSHCQTCKPFLVCPPGFVLHAAPSLKHAPHSHLLHLVSTACQAVWPPVHLSTYGRDCATRQVWGRGTEDWH